MGKTLCAKSEVIRRRANNLKTGGLSADTVTKAVISTFFKQLAFYNGFITRVSLRYNSEGAGGRTAPGKLAAIAGWLSRR
ncbi:hypothetical protein [Siccibacter turicensis]|uniref:hypothetical protein n=1 Tax=Siccibacter turicensis TaxID=357233 RepID=UPI003F575DCE